MATDHHRAIDHHRHARAPGADRVTTRDIVAFLDHLDRARAGGPAQRAALLAHKADLLTRLAEGDQALADPEHTRAVAEQARTQAAAAARHAEADTHDTVDVNDIRSPSSRRWGISPSNSGDFRRASSKETDHG